VIALYAITDNPGPPLPDLAPLRLVPVNGLAAVCMPAGETEMSAEAFWRHEEVLEALMADRDLLPVRYGTRLEDEDAVARAVGERRDELGAALERVRGSVELSVRVMRTGTQSTVLPAAGASSGAEYLRLRARADASRERTARALHAPLSELARASVEGQPRPQELFRAAYLVGRDGVDQFAAGVARLQQATPGVSILCTGPWPPYSFVEQ
jgi:Gas vesicle synthesis protein GvpL/GvpF